MGWTPLVFARHHGASWSSSFGVRGSTQQSQGESDMNITTVAVDLAKDVFQLAVADGEWRVVQTARLSRSQFSAWFGNRAVSRVIMEACGSAHHWARWFSSQGIEVTLLPAAYMRAYVKRNKTDAADAAALLEAARCADMPFLDEHNRQTAISHLLSGILLRSKTVPTVTVNGSRQSLHLYRPGRLDLPCGLQCSPITPQCGQTGPCGQICASRNWRAKSGF